MTSILLISCITHLFLVSTQTTAEWQQGDVHSTYLASNPCQSQFPPMADMATGEVVYCSPPADDTSFSGDVRQCSEQQPSTEFYTCVDGTVDSEPGVCCSACPYGTFCPSNPDARCVAEYCYTPGSCVSLYESNSVINFCPTVDGKTKRTCDYLWTSWFSVDTPEGEGDIEHISEMRASYPGEMCSYSDEFMEIRSRNNPSASFPVFNRFSSYGYNPGVECINSEQDSGLCHDYEVRFCCHDDNTALLNPQSTTLDIDDSKRYELFYVKQKWKIARDLCVENGGTLATIPNEDINSKIVDMLDRFVNGNIENIPADDVWISVNDRATEGVYVDAFDVPVTYTNWASGEPSEVDKFDCVALRPNLNFEWATRKPGGRNYYICEYDYPV